MYAKTSTKSINTKSASKAHMGTDIYELIVNDDEVTWQSIIYDLIKDNEIDPWDVDISKLTKQYITVLKKLKGADLRVSGKVLLAAAMLLKIKSNRFMGDDLEHLDRLLASAEKSEDEFFEEFSEEGMFLDDEADPESADPSEFSLIPRMPQPRKRKVSIYDLVSALEKALEVKNRRLVNHIHNKELNHAPGKTVDISVIINNLYRRILNIFKENNAVKLTFTGLLPQDSDRKDKVYTFLSILHLTNQGKLDLEQEKHFGEISILLRDSKSQSSQEAKA